jgi:hypothetical protein
MTPPLAVTAAAKAKPRAKRPVAKTASRSSARNGQARDARALRSRSTRGAGRFASSARIPRRVSGPARPSATAIARPRRTDANTRARRARRHRPLPQLRPVPVLGALGTHAFRAGRSLPDSPLLDRLLRGRAWVALLGVLLIGLVALNVSLLKLNAEAGRNADKVKALGIQSTQLRAKVSRLASAERLENAGRELGLAMPIAGRVRYVSARRGDGLRATRALRSTNAPLFAFASISEPPAPAVPPPTSPAPASPSPPAPIAAQPTAQAPTQAPAPGTTAPTPPPTGNVPAGPVPASGGQATPIPGG